MIRLVFNAEFSLYSPIIASCFKIGFIQVFSSILFTKLQTILECGQSQSLWILFSTTPGQRGHNGSWITFIFCSRDCSLGLISVCLSWAELLKFYIHCLSLLPPRICPVWTHWQCAGDFYLILLNYSYEVLVSLY